MKYKVGDKVRVKDDLRVDVEYGHLSLSAEMAKNCGKVFTAQDVSHLSCRFIEDGGRYWFSNEMLEPVEELHKPQFVIDKTRGLKSIYIDGITIAIPIETIVGIAYKNPADEYDEERGKSLAYYRMEGQE